MVKRKEETEELNLDDLPVMNQGKVKQEVKTEEAKVVHQKGVPFKTQNGHIRIDH